MKRYRHSEELDPLYEDLDRLMEKSRADELVPLCVDMDGTLIKTDLLLEGIIQLLKRNLTYAIYILFWLTKGKAYLKSEVAKRVQIDASSLPYNKDVLEYLRNQQRDIILVTGSNIEFANNVAGELGIFSDVIASSESVNLTKYNKRKKLVELFGKNGFDYIGNDRDDWKVWPYSRQSMVVSRENLFLRRTRRKFEITREFKLPKITFRDFIKSIRAHQWIKNVLIFIPLLLDHKVTNIDNLYVLTIGFICLSLLASLTYIINDLLDLESDRKNQTKRKRAFASGLLSIKQAVAMIAGLLCAVVLIGTQLPLPFIVVLGAYFISTLSYSLYFKRVAMLDVCILASLYTLRVIGGIIAINAEWSFWLLAFSMFFFLSLALAKRVSELENIKIKQNHNSNGRGYQVIDLPMLTSAGVSSGIVSILVVALYINGSKVLELYSFPQSLWLICPLLLYWIGRVWMITARGEMHEDPILFAIRDRVSLLSGFFVAVVVCSALFLPKLI